jgi:hypothetical protein
MPIEGPWRRLIPEQIKNVPDYSGVFELADILQETIYVGSASSLMQAILQVFDKRDPDLALAAFFRFGLTLDYAPAAEKLLADYQESFKRRPLCNERKLKSSG